MTCIGRSLLSSKSWRQIRPAPAGGAGSGASAGWSGARKGRRTDSGSGFPAKLRYIDPLVAGLGRVSRLDAGVRQAQEAFLATDFACWIGVPEETAGEND